MKLIEHNTTKQRILAKDERAIKLFNRGTWKILRNACEKDYEIQRLRKTRRSELNGR